MSRHFDTIVVGAGIFGSAAAYHAQKLGMRTLLLEQFKLGHKNGSSHGKSRIIRYAHKDAPYLPLVKESYEQIEEMEKRRGEQLWRNTGLVWASMPSNIQSISNILKNFGAVHEVLTGSQVSARYPHFQFTDDISALIDPKAGVLYADKWLNAFQDEFTKIGGLIKDGVEVRSFSDGQPVTVVTNDGDYTANKLIITVGAWIHKLIPSLPVRVQAESMAVCYWKPKNVKDRHLADDMPAFITKSIPGHTDTFAMPSVDYEDAVKICSDEGESIPAGGDHPLHGNELFINQPQKFVASFMPKFDSNPVVVEKCKYTLSEDHHYVLDMMPNSTNIVIGACGSGAGFKVSPCVGKVLAEMAAGIKTSVDVSFFSLERFQK